ncbi:MAG: hypothetical protein ABFD54_13960 [Armatimonadota bacterium]|nr:hypothetical protein [bacterium]
MRTWVGVLLIVVIIGTGILVASCSKNSTSSIVTAPGAPRPGEPISKHFTSVVERLSNNTFKVTIKPIPPTDPEIYIPSDGAATLIRPIILDAKDNDIYFHLPDRTFMARYCSLIPDQDGKLRHFTRIMIIDLTKVPKGTYTITARVEVGEEGKRAEFSKHNFLGAMTTTVRGRYKLVVK